MAKILILLLRLLKSFNFLVPIIQIEHFQVPQFNSEDQVIINISITLLILIVRIFDIYSKRS